jgi:hypothetical protein
LTKQNGEELILTASPRQIKYYAPSFTVYNLAEHITFKESRNLIKEKEIVFFLSIDGLHINPFGAGITPCCKIIIALFTKMRILLFLKEGETNCDG